MNLVLALQCRYVCMEYVKSLHMADVCWISGIIVHVICDLLNVIIAKLANMNGETPFNLN